jgi:hypothetical protein
MGAAYSTNSGSASKFPEGLFIRPGDDFIVLGQRKGRTWAIQSSKSGGKDVKVSQVSTKGVKVSDHLLRYQAKCADDKRESPSSDVLHSTAADDVNYTSSVLLRSGVDGMHPKSDGVEWLSNDNNCLSRLERWSFVPNNPNYPSGVPLSGDTDVNIRVYNIGSRQQRALFTPNSDASSTDLEIKDKVSSWKLYRTKGWVLEGGQCKPWSIANDNIQSDTPPYTCSFPKKEDGRWQVRCFTTAGRDSLFSTKDECLAYRDDQNGGGNNGDKPEPQPEPEPEPKPKPKPKPEPKKAEETDNTVIWVVGGVVAFILIVAILAMLTRSRVSTF